MVDSNVLSSVMGLVIVALAIVAWRLYTEAVRARRERYIRGYVFSWSLLQKLISKHPELELKDAQLVARALRESFLIHLRTKPRLVGMPSRVVDDLWHELILDTRHRPLRVPAPAVSSAMPRGHRAAAAPRAAAAARAAAEAEAIE